MVAICSSEARVVMSEVDLSRCAYVDPTARVFGRVTAAEGVSLWPYAVIRAEHTSVEIGAFTNIQDHAMVHIGYTTPVRIGAYCSITHRVVVHGCIIEDNCLIGIGATIMDRAVIGANSIVAGHSFVREGTIIPPNSIVMGTPAKVVSTRDNSVANRLNASMYLRNAEAYARGDHRAWHGKTYQDALASWQAELTSKQL
jgi:carbonic anhydrase/acetyltransferase-like protein (isoleucine patch superfamily)